MDKQKVFIVTQVSNCDGEHFINTIPCTTLDVAKIVMQNMIDTVLEECPQYEGLDLEIDSSEFYAEVSDTMVEFGCAYDDYDERFEITEKEIECL